MTASIISRLTQEELSIEDLFQSWRKQYQDDTDEGVCSIVQLCVDLTGYDYVLQTNDLGNRSTIQELVLHKILQSQIHDNDVFNQPVVLQRVYDLLQLMIVHNSQELLSNNIWLNNMMCLLVAFCESKDDDCVTSSAYLSTLLLVHISVVRNSVQKELEKSQVNEEDEDTQDELVRRGRYLLKSCRLLIRNVEAGCGYHGTLTTISSLFCRLLEAYPDMYVLDQAALNVLSKLLRLRHPKTFQTVANCFKVLLNPELQSPEVINAIASFFIETVGESFIQSLVTHKSSVKVAIEVVAYMQKRQSGHPIFSEEITDKVRQFMFHSDGFVRALAINFHLSTLTKPDGEEFNVNEVLLHILKLFERYEHSFEALGSLIEHLWQLEFFDDWNLLFKILAAEVAREDNLFMVSSITHIINQSFDLLMNELTSANQPDQEDVNQDRLKRLLQQFLQLYPAALQSCSRYEQAYVKLLYPGHACHHDTLMLCNINVGSYYEELFAVLEMIAHKCTDFYTLRSDLSVIRSYWSLVIDVEAIWSELVTQYTDQIYDTRLKITSKHINKRLSDAYYLSVSQLTALLEINSCLYDNLDRILQLVDNDLTLLDKLKFAPLQASMFYRMYKCVLYTLFEGNQLSPEKGIVNPVELPGGFNIKKKKCVRQLLDVLIKQLARYNEPLDFGVNIFITLCDMLMLTSINEPNIPQLANISYQVQPPLLGQMAKFLLNYLFSTEYGWQEAPIKKQREMLEKYIELYRLHKALPQITDTHFIVANYSLDTQFEDHIKQLMLVLHRADPSQFCEVISQAAFQLLLFYKSESSVKNFFKKFQSFALTKLTIDDQQEFSNVIARVVEKILNHTMSVFADKDVASDVKRMFKLVLPMLPQMLIEDRLQMEHLLVRRQEYGQLPDAERKTVDKFIKHLHK